MRLKLKKEIVITIPVGSEVHVYGGIRHEDDDNPVYNVYFPPHQSSMRFSQQQLDEYVEQKEEE